MSAEGSKKPRRKPAPPGTRDRPRFYGRRKLRGLKPRQKALLETVLPDMEIRLPSGGAPVDPRGLFDQRIKDVWLEIGFGAGEHLAAMAQAYTDYGFLGCEPYMDGLARLLGRIEKHRIQNIRVFPEDARLLLPGLSDGSLGRVYLLFPDPWPKTRHHKRRFIQPDQLDDLARLIRPGGQFVFASYHAGYVAWTLDKVRRHPGFRWTATSARDWQRPPKDWFGTRYEAKALQKGIPCTYLIFERVNGA